MSERAWKAGEVVGTYYRLEFMIGRGGAGEVWRAVHLGLERRVAIKRLAHPDFADHPHERFLREARTAARLSHPSIVAVHDLILEDNTLFIVMEYVDGIDLKRVIESGFRKLGWQVAISLDVARGLFYAHGQGILHRDIKPGNILVDNSDGRAKITDFGIATTLARKSAITRSGSFLGTPVYASPEQIKGQALGLGADIFSLGVSLYEFFTGIYPFGGSADSHVAEIIHGILNRSPQPPRLLRNDIPEELSRLLLKMLAKEPNERPESMADVVTELAKIHDGVYLPQWRGFQDGSPEPSKANNPVITTAARISRTVPEGMLTKLGRKSAPTGFFERTTVRRAAFFASDEDRYGKIQETVKFYRDHLDGEYQSLMAQAKQTYRLWIICVVIGMAMLVAGVATMLAGFVNEGIAASACSVVTYFIQKIFQQREDFYRLLARKKTKHLEYGNHWLLAIQTVDAIEDPAERAVHQARLADVLAERLSANQVQVGLPAQVPSKKSGLAKE